VSPIRVTPSEPKRFSTASSSAGKATCVLDLAVGVHMVERVRDQPVGAAFRGEPEAALAVGGDAFKVEQLGRLAAAGDAGGFGDLRRASALASMVKIVGCMA
jgi:hypothetical protein